MAARDRYSVALKCPKCGKTGDTQVSEDDHPWIRDPHFSVDELSIGFTVTKLGRTLVDTEISCNDCQIRVK